MYGVAAARPEAVNAGMHILEKGGNFFDFMKSSVFPRNMKSWSGELEKHDFRPQNWILRRKISQGTAPYV